MPLSNVLFFAGVFMGSMIFWSAPSGSLALHSEAERKIGWNEFGDHHRVYPGGIIPGN